MGLTGQDHQNWHGSEYHPAFLVVFYGLDPAIFLALGQILESLLR